MRDVKRSAALGTLVVWAALGSCERRETFTPAPTVTSSPTPSRIPKHDVRFTFAQPLTAHHPTRLSAALYLDGVPADDALEPTEGEPLHVVIVTRDLKWFQHAHPVFANGAYTMSATFPYDGSYVAFAYFRTSAGAVEVSRQELVVGRASDRAVAPLALTSRNRKIGKLEVKFSCEPDPPRVQQGTTLTFQFLRAGAALTEFRPAAQHHLVAISEDASELVYGHSTIGEATGGMRSELHLPVDAIHGDESIHTPVVDGRISYHILFKRPGRYKVWCEAVDRAQPATFVIATVSDNVQNDFPHKQPSTITSSTIR